MDNGKGVYKTHYSDIVGYIYYAGLWPQECFKHANKNRHIVFCNIKFLCIPTSISYSIVNCKLWHSACISFNSHNHTANTSSKLFLVHVYCSAAKYMFPYQSVYELHVYVLRNSLSFPQTCDCLYQSIYQTFIDVFALAKFCQTVYTPFKHQMFGNE